MKPSIRLLLVIALAAILPGCIKPQPQAPARMGERIRVVSWNIQWFPGRIPDAPQDRADAHLREARKAITAIEPDILLLQEIRDWPSAQALCDAVPELRVQVASRFPESAQNQIIAARFQADSGWSALWNSGPVTPPRGYSFAAFEAPGSRYLLTYSLHLKSNRGDHVDNIHQRREAIRQLIEHLRETLPIYQQRGPCAVVIGGDFNTSADDPRFASDPTLKALRAAGFHWTHDGIAPENRVTIPASGPFPDNCFDHIFTMGLGQPRARVEPQPEASDHNPVILDLDLAAANFQSSPALDAALKLLREAVILPPPEPELVAGVLAATDDAALRAAIGKRAAVEGTISRVGQTANGSIVFLNFQGVPRDGFVAIVRATDRAALEEKAGGALSQLEGRRIRVAGELTLFRTTPQVALTSPDQLTIIP
jgi:endonuclease/exonuclease/phosphatase family metal-dependent hydrolase